MGNPRHAGSHSEAGAALPLTQRPEVLQPVEKPHTILPATVLCAVYELDGVGRDGQRKLFEKPWAMTTVMFCGMTFCLPLAYWVEYQEKCKRKAAAAAGEAAEPLLGNGPVGARGGRCWLGVRAELSQQQSARLRYTMLAVPPTMRPGVCGSVLIQDA